MLKLALLATLLLFSLSGYPSVQSSRATSESKGIEYICGNKCFAIEKVIFELRVNRQFINERDLWFVQMNRFERRFKVDIERLDTAHKIKMEAGARIESLLLDYVLQESVLKVYVSMKEASFDASQIVFEVVSLSENGNGFQRLVCKKGDDDCINATLLHIYEYHLLKNVRDHVAPTAIE